VSILYNLRGYRLFVRTSTVFNGFALTKCDNLGEMRKSRLNT